MGGSGAAGTTVNYGDSALNSRQLPTAQARAWLSVDLVHCHRNLAVVSARRQFSALSP